ncbi:MAG: GNAT family N-acetyltransferase [Actinobacteria bacterium]|nr:GNAT family N-acetyltransferase [Actinomycetota bacterium]
MGSNEGNTSSALRGAAGWPLRKASNALWRAGGVVRASTPDVPDITGPGLLVKATFYPVRTLTADDTEALFDFIQDGLSDDSRYMRFLTPMPTVPESAATWLADRDGHDRMALAALDPDDFGHIVAVVEYARVPEGQPEVAVAVADDYQGQGLGCNLLRMLATMSLAAGEPVWQCSMLADNEGSVRVMECVGDIEQVGISDAIRSVLVHLDPDRLLGLGPEARR